MSDVRTAARTLQIFEAFAEAGEAMSLSDIAARLEIPVSSCFQLVRTLIGGGFVFGVGRRQVYYPTRRLLDVMQRVAQRDPLIHRVQRTLDELRDLTGETVSLGTLQIDKVVYLATAESRQMLRVTIAVGSVRPVYSTATGKALLTCLDPDPRRDLLDKLEMEAFTAKTLTTPAEVLADLRAGCERGYHTTFGEGAAGLSGLAIPVSIDGHPYAISVSGPSDRIEARETDLGAALRNVVLDVRSPLAAFGNVQV